MQTLPPGIFAIDPSELQDVFSFAAKSILCFPALYLKMQETTAIPIAQQVQHCIDAKQNSGIRTDIECSIQKSTTSQPRNFKKSPRNIFTDILDACEISSSNSPREPIRVRRDLIAGEVLSWYPIDTVITRELYDTDTQFGELLIWLNPHFEFPDWEGYTLYKYLRKFATKADNAALNALQISSKQINKDGVCAVNVTLQHLFDAQPIGESGWLLPSGLEVWFH
ncbi:hypothetical protein [Undibacterium oligocarboniphilum]|uniref:Uncharacterized protein n=1 Tax=Undibacterium oligocarboniphilum TaxID=666702 RepID=A0A850QTR4_9BURK|nr:hypothetical protein [Undibacterium oligocarboniphilum]MBC3871750.1 hypothetical protein [Undibacterium oligocarboniphilum]NVO79386.1 hypothetical protein [Undibacterium oligocarboniphilum]